MIIPIIAIYIAVFIFCVLIDMIRDRWILTTLFVLLTAIGLSITVVGFLLGMGFKIAEYFFAIHALALM